MWSPSRPQTIGLLSIVCLLLSACGGSSTTPLSQVTPYRPVQGQPLGPAQGSVAQAGGGTWAYTKPASGHLTLVYFGYTSCPDVCPATMADLASALTKVPEAVSAKVWVEFVSTDPHRDTLTKLQRWTAAFSPAFHGGRAPIGEVIAAARSYGIGIEAPKVGAGDYEVTHGAQLVVLDQHGGEVGFFRELAGAKAYAEALPTLVKDYA